ncbi:MAG: hypothetical protein AAGL90_03140 [Pseudomonadota bacterium]
MEKKDILVLYEHGKQRRYNLLFAVNGGAFAVGKLLGEPNQDVGGLTLQHLAIGMISITVVLATDIFFFGLARKRECPDLFNLIGQLVLILLSLLVSFGWLLVGFG